MSYFWRATRSRWCQVTDLNASQLLPPPWVSTERQARLCKITHHQCLNQLSPPSPPSSSLTWIMSGNLVMGTSISWTSPALPLLKKGEGVGIFLARYRSEQNWKRDWFRTLSPHNCTLLILFCQEGGFSLSTSEASWVRFSISLV